MCSYRENLGRAEARLAKQRVDRRALPNTALTENEDGNLALSLWGVGRHNKHAGEVIQVNSFERTVNLLQEAGGCRRFHASRLQHPVQSLAFINMKGLCNLRRNKILTTSISLRYTRVVNSSC